MTYDDLRDRIGDALGYGLSVANWTANATKTERVERILLAGLNRFFQPPVLPGEVERHRWTFLTPTRPFSLVAGDYLVSLPAGFAGFTGPLTYAPGVSVLYPPIQEYGAERVRYELQATGATGRPTIFGVRVESDAVDDDATRWEMLVFPTPDQDYTVYGEYKINPVYPTAAGDIPIGGQPHEQTLIEACLAEWEMFDEYAGQAHQMRFMECLISSVSEDRRMTAPKALGYNGDPGAYRTGFRRDWHDMDENRTFYNGITT